MMKNFLKKYLQFLPKKYFDALVFYYYKLISKKYQCCLSRDYIYIYIYRDGKKIILDKSHSIYIFDIMKSFDYYFNATIAEENVRDYSKMRQHSLLQYKKQKIYFPSIPEPEVTAAQYIDFANLKSGDVIIDLGAYSGLTAILFKEQVGKNGIVISVECDETNLLCIKENFKKFEEINKDNIFLEEKAIWNEETTLSFSSEGSMGSSILDFVGKGRGKEIQVQTTTLMQLAKKIGLSKIDFIKCDIEGSEIKVFTDEFLTMFKPKVIIEPHYVNGVLSAKICKEQFEKNNYICKEIIQDGVDLPLLECIPK